MIPIPDPRRLDRRLRFLMAGGGATAVNWLSRFLYGAVLPFPAAVAAATATGMVVGFLAYRGFVFVGSRRSLPAQLSGFLVVNLVGAAVTVAAAVAVRDWVLAPQALAGSVADPLAHAAGIAAGAVVNYLGHRRITFDTA